LILCQIIVGGEYLVSNEGGLVLDIEDIEEVFEEVLFCLVE
jgi:hypothetical protein